MKKIQVELTEQGLKALLALAFPNNYPEPTEKNKESAQHLVYQMSEQFYGEVQKRLKLPNYDRLVGHYNELQSEEEKENFLNGPGFPMRLLDALMDLGEEQFPEPAVLKVKDLTDGEFIHQKFKAKWVVAIETKIRRKWIYYLWNRDNKPVLGKYEIHVNDLELSELINKLDFTGRYLVQVHKSFAVNVGFYSFGQSSRKLKALSKAIHVPQLKEISVGKIEQHGLSAAQRFQITRQRYLADNVLHKRTIGYMEELGIFKPT